MAKEVIRTSQGSKNKCGIKVKVDLLLPTASHLVLGALTGVMKWWRARGQELKLLVLTPALWGLLEGPQTGQRHQYHWAACWWCRCSGSIPDTESESAFNNIARWFVCTPKVEEHRQTDPWGWLPVIPTSCCSCLGVSPSPCVWMYLWLTPSQ